MSNIKEDLKQLLSDFDGLVKNNSVIEQDFNDQDFINTKPN